MKQPTLQQFKAFSRSNASLARAVIQAQAFAEVERERVDAYRRPIFERFGFTDDKGRKITKLSHLFMCPDEEKCAAYYAECNAADVAHGWTGPEGHCPALIAEGLVLKAHQALIAKADDLFGVDFSGSCYGENRRKLIELLMGACVAEKAVA